MVVSRYGHVNLNVVNLDRTIHFYRDLMGLDFAYQMKNEEGGIVCTYLATPDGNFLELIEKNLKPGEKAFNAAHICFEVLDVDEFMEHCKKVGIEIVGGPSRGYDGNPKCFVNDPDGNRLEIMQMTPDCPQRKYQESLKNK